MEKRFHQNERNRQSCRVTSIHACVAYAELLEQEYVTVCSGNLQIEAFGVPSSDFLHQSSDILDSGSQHNPHKTSSSHLVRFFSHSVQRSCLHRCFRLHDVDRIHVWKQLISKS